jgi:hypothetical protein
VELIGGVPGKVEPVVPPMPVLGIGTPTSGLTPGLLSSVDPSGIVPERAPGPAEDGGRAVPVAEPTAVDTQPVVMPADPTPLSPPPSKLELEPLAMPEDEEPEGQLGETAGLVPPGSISVAPSPMPLGPAPAGLLEPLNPIVPLAPGIPSGDTAPIAGGVGVVDMVCAAAAPQLNKSATAAADNRLIEISCPLSHGTRTLMRSFCYIDKHRKRVRH